MEFTNEQVQEAMASNEEFRGQVLQGIGESDYGKVFLGNHAQNHWDKNIGKEVGVIHGRWDDDLESATGIKKPEGQKSYSFWKDTISTMKTQLDAYDPSQLEALTLENKNLKDQGDGHFKGMYDTLRAKREEENTAFESQITELRESQRLGGVKSSLTSSSSKLKFEEALPKDLVNNFVNSAMGKLQKDAKTLEDGTIVWYKDGAPILNAKTGAKATTDEVLAAELSSVIATSGSGGGGGGGSEDPSKKKPASVPSITSVTSRIELTAAIEENLIAEGLDKRSAEFTEKADKLFSEHSKGLPLRN